MLAYHALYKGILLTLPAASPLAPWDALLDVGVPIFFVLSGFLLYGPFVRARLRGVAAPDVQAYGWRRVMGIVAAYWVAAYFALLQIYNPDTAGGAINPAWTLCVEVIARVSPRR